MDNNEGVTDELCCSTLPSANPQLSIPWLEQELPSTAGPKMIVLQKLSKALKFVFLPYWIAELFKYFCETNYSGMFIRYEKRKTIRGVIWEMFL